MAHNKTDSNSLRASPESFRFLDLPKELRLMVYEFLPNTTRRINFIKVENDITISSFTLLFTRTVSTAILATSREVKEEAQPILAKTTGRFCGVGTTMSRGPGPRIECDTSALQTLLEPEGLIRTILQWYHEPKGFRPFYAMIIDQIIGAKDYRPEGGTREQGLYIITQFTQDAARAFRSQKETLAMKRAAGNDEATTPMIHPVLQIAMRKRSGDNAAKLAHAMLLMTVVLEHLHAAQAVAYRIPAVIHVLSHDIEDSPELNLWSRAVAKGLRLYKRFPGSVNLVSLSDLAAVPGVVFLDKSDDDVYYRTWREGEWL